MSNKDKTLAAEALTFHEQGGGKLELRQQNR